MPTTVQTTRPDLTADPERHRRWLPRSRAEEPISAVGAGARLRLELAAAESPARTVEALAAVWFEGSDCSRLDRDAFVLYSLGRRDADIAGALGVCRRAVPNMLRRARCGLVTRARDLSDAPLARAALTLWLADEPRPVVAHVLGVRLESLERALGRFVREALSVVGGTSVLAADCSAEASAPRRREGRVVVIG